ncbi:hypothetical protein [Microbacterium maritypicum]
MKLNDRKLRPASRLLLALPIAALAFSLAACGGAAPRPSADDVAAGIGKVFEEQGFGDTIDADASQCLAEYLVDSDLSDETLNYLANGEDKQANQEDKDITTKVIADHLQECAA